MNKNFIGFLIAILIVLGLTDGVASAADTPYNIKNNHSLPDIAVNDNVSKAAETKTTPSTYTVKNGDTLWNIAERNDVSVDDLLSWNDLQSPLIYPDQEIQIEDQKEVYIVQLGDTLSQIAKVYDVTLSDLMGWNGVTNHLIFPGEELTIGGASKTVQQTKQASAATSAPAPKKKQAASGPPAQTKTVTNQAPAAGSGTEMTVTATAYTAYCTGCSGITYTGINLRANPNQKVIAVDPSVIPLGSRVWVEGYGEAIAGDIGGAIKGNIIDVFLQNKQDAYNWGRKKVKIKVLD